MTELAPKQRRFVDEYLIDLNATQAAIRAGYSERTANEQGARLLANVSVREAIEEGKASLATRAQVTQEMWVNELRRVAFGDLRKSVKWGPDGVTLVDSSELSDDDAAAISEVGETKSENGGSLKIKRHDKLKALELLGRHLGFYDDKVTLKGPLLQATINL